MGLGATDLPEGVGGACQAQVHLALSKSAVALFVGALVLSNGAANAEQQQASAKAYKKWASE